MFMRDLVPFVHNFKNVKIAHGEMLLLVNITLYLLKVTLLHGCFSRFFYFFKWYQIAQPITKNIP